MLTDSFIKLNKLKKKVINIVDEDQKTVSTSHAYEPLHLH